MLFKLSINGMKVLKKVSLWKNFWFFAEGWKPLCEFLRVPIPDIQFPKLNTREGFNKRIRNMNFIGEDNNSQ